MEYIPDTERVSALAYTAMDPDWPGQIDTDGAILIIIEGLTMYLNEPENRTILKIIGVHLYRPIFRLFTGFSLLRKRMDYIAVLEK